MLGVALGVAGLAAAGAVVALVVRNRRELDAAPHPPIPPGLDPGVRRALVRHYRDRARAVRRMRRRRGSSGGAGRYDPARYGAAGQPAWLWGGQSGGEPGGHAGGHSGGHAGGVGGGHSGGYSGGMGGGHDGGQGGDAGGGGGGGSW